MTDLSTWTSPAIAAIAGALIAELRSRQRINAAVRDGFITLATEAKVNRERQDERHEANQEIMQEISKDVKRINGQVAFLTSQGADHEREINRLRDHRQ